MHTVIIKKLDDLTNNEIYLWNYAVNNKRCNSPFLTYTYAKSAKKSGFDVYVILFLKNNFLTSILPIQFNNKLDKLLGIADRVGGGMSDRMSFIQITNENIDIINSLNVISALRIDHFRHNEFDKINFLENTRKNIGYELLVTDSIGADIKTVNKKRFLNLQNRKRKLQKDYGYITTAFTKHPELSDIKEIIGQKRNQFELRSVGNVFSDRRNMDLLLNIKSLSNDNCSLHLTKTSAGGKWVASHLGLISGNKLHYWFPVYNKDLKAYSPGLILLDELIESSQKNNIYSIDFGEGESEYKKMFSNITYINDRQFITRKNFLGFLCSIKEAIHWRISKYF